MDTTQLDLLWRQLDKHGISATPASKRIAGQLYLQSDQRSLVQIKTLICPLVAKNKGQQERFYRLFDEYFDSTKLTRDINKQIKESNYSQGKPTTPVAQPAWPKWIRFVDRYWRPLLAVAVSVCIIIFLYRNGFPRLPQSIFDNYGTSADSTFTDRHYSKQTAFKFFMVALLFALSWGVTIVFDYFGARKKAHRISQIRQQRRTPPYLLELSAEKRVLTPFLEEAKRLTEGWQQVEQPGFDLDVEKSIYASIRSGDTPQTVYAPQKEKAAYLFLVSLNTKNEHQVQLSNLLYTSLKSNGTCAERFFFQTNPSTCWNENHTAGITLEMIADWYASYHLVLIGTASYLLQTGQSRDYCLQQFSRWKTPVLLSTQPVVLWGKEEVLLSEYFTLLPASAKGVEQVPFQIHGRSYDSVQQYREWLLSSEPQPRIVRCPGDSTRETRLQSPGLKKWLAACALYPKLEWAITLQLGEEASKDFPGLLSLDNLFRLSQLHWFHKGSIPDGERRRLVESLTEKEVYKYRKCIIDVLHRNEPKEKKSRAHREHSLQLARQQVLLTPHTPYNWKTLNNRLPHEIGPDFELDNLIKSNPARLPAFLLPVLPFLYKNGLPFWGLRQQVRKWLLFMTLSIVSLVGLKKLPSEAVMERLGITGYTPEIYAFQILEEDEVEEITVKKKPVEPSFKFEKIETLSEKTDKLRKGGNAVFEIDDNVNLDNFKFLDIFVEVKYEAHLKEVRINFGEDINDQMLKLDEDKSDTIRYVFRGKALINKNSHKEYIYMTAHAAGKDSQKLKVSRRTGRLRVIF